MGLTAALATAGQSLQTFSTGIEVAGQNIANAGTPGYIREELLLQPSFPYQTGNLILGTGVEPIGIQQQIDVFLEARIHTANSEVSAAQARDVIYRQLQAEIRELGDTDLSTALNNFLATLNDVANQPESPAVREIAVQEGQQLAEEISNLRARLDELRTSQTIKVDSLVDEANRLIAKIEELNPQIAKLEAAGLQQSDAGALRTQRYAALNRLSEIIPISYRENANGSIDVFTGNTYLILTGASQRLETVSTTDQGVLVQNVVLSVTKSPIPTSGGELAGVIEGRDVGVGGFIERLDQFTSSLIFEFNRIHSSGEGLKGFSEVTAASAVDDVDAVLTDAGLAFSPTHGSFQVKVVNTLTGLAETTNIEVDLDGIDPAGDTTLNTLRADLDSVDGLTAVITTDGRLQLTADAGFEIRFSSDTSGALAALGINTFFTGSDSSNVGVNAVVAGDQAYLATGQGGGPADGRNVVELAAFIDNPLQSLGGQSLSDFYDTTVSELAQSAASEAAVAEGFAAFRDSLLSQREQFSGVSLDEEAIDVLEFQRAYQAAARLISIIDELFTTLLSV